jgi:DNA-binding transcriptional MerR regulator
VSRRATGRLGIGELARRSGLSISAVRFYSDRGLLPPAGIDPASGYRSYDDEQVDEAVVIRDLRRLGLALAEVETFLASPPEIGRALIEDQLRALERRLHDARAVAHTLHARLSEPERPMTTATMTVAAHELGRALDQVLPAVSRDDGQPMLRCVLIEGRGGSLRLVATDSYRLAVRDLAAEGDPAATFAALIEADALRGCRSELPVQGRLAVTVEDDALVVRGEGVELRRPRVTGPFPAYEAVLCPPRHAHEILVERRMLQVAFDHFARQGDAVLVSTGTGELSLARRDERLSLAARHDAPSLHVALNPTCAAEAVAAAVGPDLAIEVAESLQPVVFRSADDGTFTTLLMPVALT